MLGSMEPERVPIMIPSSGVNPMLVSTLFPFATAVTEAPLPRWQTMSRDELGGTRSIWAARHVEY